MSYFRGSDSLNIWSGLWFARGKFLTNTSEKPQVWHFPPWPTARWERRRWRGSKPSIATWLRLYSRSPHFLPLWSVAFLSLSLLISLCTWFLKDERFGIQGEKYKGQQYSHIYYVRLHQMRSFLQSLISKWKPHLPGNLIFTCTICWFCAVIGWLPKIRVHNVWASN